MTWPFVLWVSSTSSVELTTSRLVTYTTSVGCFFICTNQHVSLRPEGMHEIFHQADTDTSVGADDEVSDRHSE
jgi:hypothetical protein